MKPKSPKAPTVLSATDSLEGLTPHKDHFHDASGKKVFPGSSQYSAEELTPHKDHWHTADGTKVYDNGQAPQGIQEKPPTEEDVMDETVNKQRELQRRARRKGGSAFTILSRGGGPYGRSNKLV